VEAKSILNYDYVSSTHQPKLALLVFLIKVFGRASVFASLRTNLQGRWRGSEERRSEKKRRKK
jgi:hypothetical protein